MTEHNRLVENIQTKMAFYVSNLRISNDRDYYDENKEAEYFFCKPLSLLFDADVTNVNSEQRNFPGIDLANKKEGISFQITSTNTKKKVQYTLDEFLTHSLDDDFERLVVLIVTLDTPPKCTNLKFQRDFDFNVKRDVWNISRLVQEFADLPVDKRHLLQAFSDYLDQELPSIEPQKPHLELPLSSKLQASGFVGREAELNEIRSRFAQGDKLVVLTGLGGIGKTELAIRYGQTHPGKVYFTRFDTSFTRTLANMAQGIRPRLSDDVLREDDGALCKRVLELLEKADPQDLLIIDNADSETGTLTDLQGDPGYAALTKIPLKLLLTTRSDTSRAIPVEPMPDTALIQIFRNHNAQLTDQEMADLIRAVNGHTMTIDLIARTLNGKGWRKISAADILTALRENTLSSQKYRMIATDYSQSPEQAQIYEHLSVVFNVSGIPDESKAVLSYATLLPDVGMDADCFGRSIKEDEQSALDILLECGWLEIKNNLLSIHPIIRLVCRTEIPPTDKCCEAFLNRLIERYDKYNYQKDRYLQIAKLLTNAAHLLEDAKGDCAWWAATLWRMLGDFRQALECDILAMKKTERIYPPDHPDLAFSYNNVSITYGNLGDYQKAMEYNLKALDIWEKVLPSNHLDLATSYSNMGTSYADLGDHRKALEYNLKALAIREQVLSADHPDLATIYNNVGTTHANLGDHRNAQKYLLKALTIREQVLPENHPSLAASYNNVGSIYGDLGDHKKALEYKLRALAIREQVLPEDHPELAQSYNNVGSTFSNLGNHRKALDYLLKALDIWNKTLPPNHPDLAVSYNNVGGTYGNLGNHRKALKYQQNALVILEKALPEDHPDLAVSYNNVGYAHGKLGEHKKELEYYQKAQAIQKKVLPSDHPDLAASYSNIAWTYYEMGQFRDAAWYMRRAADIINRSSLPERHPNRVNYPKWAEQFETEARMQQDMLAKMQQWGLNPFGLPQK